MHRHALLALTLMVMVAAVFVACPTALGQGAGPKPAAPAAGAGKIPDTVEVTETGAGMDEAEAMRDALRKCVEKGAGTYIFSSTETKDFVLAKDTVLAKAAGFVVKKEVVKPAKQLEDGTWTVTVKAVVSVKGISDVWGTVKTMLQEMGRPKIMVWLDEKIDDRLRDDSTVQTAIEKALLDSGFLLVNKEQIKEIDKKDLSAAVAEDKPDKVQAIAKRFGAQIFISGHALTTAGKRSVVGGVDFYNYEAVANVKTYRSDDAMMMSAVPGRATRGSGRVSTSAAQQSLDFQGQAIAAAVREDILNHWMEIMQGRGELKLEVDNIKFAQVVKLTNAIKGLKEVKDCTRDSFNNNVAVFAIQSDVKADKLAEKLVEKMEKQLEVTDVTNNVIKAKYVGE
jgi:hypothetical protein